MPKKSLKTRECADLGDGEAVGDDVVPGVAGVGGAQVGDGEGEGRADQVKCVHQGQHQQQPRNKQSKFIYRAQSCRQNRVEFNTLNT